MSKMLDKYTSRINTYVHQQEVSIQIEIAIMKKALITMMSKCLGMARMKKDYQESGELQSEG